MSQFSLCVVLLIFGMLSSSNGRRRSFKSLAKPKSTEEGSCTEELASMRRHQKLTNTRLDNMNSKLDNILRVLEDIDRNTVHDAMCGLAFCGGHGNCTMADDMSGFLCQCEELYGGEHCEVSGPCALAWLEYNEMPPMPGVEEPLCNDDGFYGPVQFRGSQAICVDENGTYLGYQVDRWEASPNMDCACARSGQLDECNDDGSFPEYDSMFGFYDGDQSSDYFDVMFDIYK